MPKKTKTPHSERQVPTISRERINEAFSQVSSLISTIARKAEKGDLLTHLQSLKEALLAEENKEAIRKLMRQISTVLRKTPDAEQPKFERMHFYLWVVDKVEGAKEVLVLLDDIDVCPDVVMCTVRDSYKREHCTYNTFLKND